MLKKTKATSEGCFRRVPIDFLMYDILPWNVHTKCLIKHKIWTNQNTNCQYRFIIFLEIESVIDNSLVEVEDVESLLVCARLCLDTIKSGNIVNGWMFDSAIQLCACSYLDPTLCLAEKSLNPLTTDKEIHSDISLGFVMLSMTLQCGNVHKNIVYNQFQPQTFYRIVCIGFRSGHCW